MVIYRLLGDKGEEHFANNWAVGVGIDQATQWQGVLQTAVQVVIILTLLERMGFVTGNSWLENYLDQCSIQATMIGGVGLSWYQRTKAHMQLSMRLEGK